MKKIFLTVLTLTLLVLNLTGCANDVETFETYIRKGNYTDAIRLYQDKLTDNQQDSQTCREMVETYLADSLNRYRTGELPQSEFDAIMDTMTKLEDYLYLVDNLEEVYVEYRDVRQSKADFRKAESLRNEGRLDAAWEAYSAVLPEDTENFSDARKNMEDLVTKMQDDARNSLLQAYEQKDYPAVFLAYRNAEQNRYVTVTEEMTDIRDAASMEFLHGAELEAQQAFGGAAKDYNAALESLRKAKADVSEEPALLAELEAMAETYKAYIPVELIKLDPLNKASFVKVGTSDSDVYTDINGSTHDRNSVISATGAWHNDRAESDKDASVSYNLNYGYSTLTGVIYRPYVFLTYTGDIPAGRCRVKIYGDGALLYEYSDPGDTGTPWDVIPVEVDVSGVRKLTVVIYGCWDAADSYLDLPEWNPGICLADCILQK